MLLHMVVNVQIASSDLRKHQVFLPVFDLAMQESKQNPRLFYVSTYI